MKNIAPMAVLAIMAVVSCHRTSYLNEGIDKVNFSARSEYRGVFLLDSVFSRISGEWININSSKKLEKERSIYGMLEENKGERIIYLKISADSGEHSLIYSYDMYDSGVGIPDSLRIDADGGGYMLIYEGRDYGDRISLLPDDDVIALKYSKADGSAVIDTFARVMPGFEEYLNRIILVGTYRDERGQVALFSSNGKVYWDNDSAEYTVGRYFDVPSSDYFRVSKTNAEHGTYRRTYSYKWIDGKLHVFAVKSDDSDLWQVEEIPLHILTPVDQ